MTLHCKQTTQLLVTNTPCPLCSSTGVFGVCVNEEQRPFSLFHFPVPVGLMTVSSLHQIIQQDVPDNSDRVQRTASVLK